MSDKGKCEHCAAEFGYGIIHSGFNDSAYAYCEKCGCTAVLDGWKLPAGTKVRIHQAISKEAEKELEACECGGRFRHGASPRCPHCRRELSAELAARWIEANAPGTAKGWKWQRDWVGCYMISVERHFTRDNWKKVGQPDDTHSSGDAPLRV